jgi:hypothetical protein
MAVFLLLIASFCVKTGLKNSYAPRFRLSGIFERTRDLDPAYLLYKPKSVKETILCISSFSTMEMIQFFSITMMDEANSYHGILVFFLIMYRCQY